METSPAKRFIDVAPSDTLETLRRRTSNFSAEYEIRFNRDDYPRATALSDRRWARYFDRASYEVKMRAELLRRKPLAIRATEIAVGDALPIGERLYEVQQVSGDIMCVVLDLVDDLAPRCFPKMNFDDSMERNAAFATAIRREYQPRALVQVARRVAPR